MNPELVAQITKMVLERLGGDGTGPSTSLTDAELRRWGEISASMQRSNVGMSDNGMRPLHAQDIERWNAITERFGNPNPQSMEPAGQVRFYSHN
ncbi:hypothetical protein MKY41_08845 [Sporosarcina sp. FSL W7-1349]|uniref:hypothetical protein n=1 Tax=Sporosarcina sp. FSL W7-1349 TaxID=2921561 RepID=UPI0030F64A48